MRNEFMGRDWHDYVPDFTTALPWLAGDGVMRRMLRSLVAKITALEQGGRLLHRAHQMEVSRANPFAGIAQVCALQVDGAGALPAGPLVVVANHPTGPMDGISYGSWLFDQRPDAIILTNGALANIPLFEGRVVGLSLYDDAASARVNAMALKRVIKHLQSGGCVAAFPAGTIGWRQADGTIRDPQWMTTVFELAMRTRAQVACIRIHARNRAVMERALSWHSQVRTFLLGWSFLDACGGKHELNSCGLLRSSDYGNAHELATAARRRVEAQSFC